MIEIILAALVGFKTVLIITTLVLCVASFFMFMSADIAHLGGVPDKTVNRIKKLLITAFVCGIFSCVPLAEDLLKVRIALIKYRLASPENITKTTETIERIGKELECKYLGCADEK